MEVTPSLRKWAVEATKLQHEQNNILGSRKWDEVARNDLFSLRKKIGFAAFGVPDQNPELENYCIGYSNEKLDLIKKISSQFLTQCKNHHILFQCAFLILYQEGSSSFPTTAVFRTVDIKNKTVFIDCYSRVYNTWEDFLDSNNLHKCLYCCPFGGQYDSNKHFSVQFQLSPACKFSKKAIGLLDTITAIGGLGAAVGGIVTSAPILAPIVVGTGIYHAVRSLTNLYDRKTHKQSIGLKDRESRNSWLCVASSAVGAACVGAVSSANNALQRGQVLSRSTMVGLKSINAASLVVNGLGFADTLLLCKDKISEGTLKASDYFNLSCELFFFYNAVSSAKTTHNLLNQMAKVNVRPTSTTVLTKTQKRNLQKRRAKSRARIQIMYENTITANPSNNSLANLIFTLAEHMPYIQDLLNTVQSMGHDVKSWLNGELSLSNLIINLVRDIEQLSTQFREYLCVLQKTYNNIKEQINILFPTSSEAHEISFYSLLTNIENEVDSVQNNTNNDIEKMYDPLEKTTFNDNEEVDQEVRPESDIEELVIKAFELVTNSIIPCKNLIEFNYLIESIKCVVVEEYWRIFLKYERDVKAARQSKAEFDLSSFNLLYGIEEDCGKHFFHNALNNINSERLIVKIRALYNKQKIDNNLCINILNGSAGNDSLYPFYGPERRGQMTYQEYLSKINRIMNINLNIDSVSFQDHNKFMLVQPNTDICNQMKSIVIYYYVNNDNTTCGLIAVYK